MPENNSGYRPDITSVAQSLLGEYQANRRNSHKSNDRDMMRAVLLQLGVGIGNSILKQKAESFLSNERVLQARVKADNGVKDTESIYNTRKAIDGKGVSDEIYFSQNSKPLIKERVDREHPEQKYTPESLDKYNDYIDKLAREVGVKQAIKFFHELSFYKC